MKENELQRNIEVLTDRIERVEIPLLNDISELGDPSAGNQGRLALVIDGVNVGLYVSNGQEWLLLSNTQTNIEV